MSFEDIAVYGFQVLVYNSTESSLVVGKGTDGFIMQNVIVDDFRDSKDFPSFVILF